MLSNKLTKHEIISSIEKRLDSIVKEISSILLNGNGYCILPITRWRTNDDIKISIGTLDDANTVELPVKREKLMSAKSLRVKTNAMLYEIQTELEIWVDIDNSDVPDMDVQRGCLSNIVNCLRRIKQILFKAIIDEEVSEIQTWKHFRGITPLTDSLPRDLLILVGQYAGYRIIQKTHKVGGREYDIAEEMDAKTLYYAVEQHNGEMNYWTSYENMITDPIF
jgi:hypothetical protein